MTSLKEILDFVETFAPLSLQEPWDNSGLQLGQPGAEVRKILLALNPTLSVVTEAVDQNADLLVTHHPLIFSPLKTLDLSDPLGKALGLAVQRGLTIYSCHTSLDKAENGTSKILAERLNLKGIKPLIPEGELTKLAVFVPRDHTEKVMNAMAEAGAGHIGNYSHCSFWVRGTGTFLPLKGSTPFIGKTGSLEKVEEDRLEMIFPLHLRSKILDALIKSHPYEEAAYDLYPLANPNPLTGLGAVGSLAEPLSAREFIDTVKSSLGPTRIKFSGKPPGKVQKVACLGGSGGKFLKTALSSGADAYVTGDVGHHEALEAAEAGILLVDAGHHATEWPAMEALSTLISKQFPEIEILLSKKDSNPFSFA